MGNSSGQGTQPHQGESQQIALLATGSRTFGTEGAANVLFDPDVFSNVAKQAPAHWERKNMEVLIRVSAVGPTPSAPQLVAARLW